MRRGEVVFAVASVLAAGLFVIADGLDRPTPAQESGLAPGPFLSAGWYCPVPPTQGYSSRVATTNLGNSSVHLRKWAVGGGKTSPFVDSDLGELSRDVAQISSFNVAGGAAVVEVFGAASASDTLTLAPGAGVGGAGCSAQPSDKWLFALGSTARGEDTHLLVLNPFEEEAIVRVRFLTPGGEDVPARLRDYLVPALTQTSIFLAEFFPETERFGMEVSAVRGRVVVARFTRVATRDGRRGIHYAVGTRDPSTRWLFAGGEVPASGEEFLSIANPSDREALIQVIFQTKDEQVAPPALAEIALPAGRLLRVKAADYLPRGVQYGSSVTSLNRVGVVAERESHGLLGGGKGAEASFGYPSSSGLWILSVGEPGGREELALANHEGNRAVVRVGLVTTSGQIRFPELSAISIEPGRRATVDLTPFLGKSAATAVVEALAGQVVIEGRLVLGEPYLDFVAETALSFSQTLERF